MNKLIILLLIIIAMLIYEIITEKKKNKILYNNYQTALKVLGEYDPKLKAYLENK